MSDTKKLLALLGVVAVARCVAAMAFPIVSGEAYYWLWSRHLAAGYFDHPPMVAWMGAICFGWIDGSVLAARASAIVLGLLSSLVVFFFARALFPKNRTAFWSAALYSLNPLFDANGIFLGPDNGLVFFCALTWLAFWKASERRDSLALWCAAGAAAGLTLLCKFHAWVLLPPLWLFLLLSPLHRPLLKTRGPWLAAIVVLIVLSPNLIWNATNDWMNYAFQLRRSHLPESEFDIENVAIFILSPALFLTPLLFWAMVCAVWKGGRQWIHDRDPRLLFLLCAGLPLPVFLGFCSFAVTISPHWPSCGYVPLIVLAVAMVRRGDLFGPRYFRWMAGLCVGATVLLHLGPMFVKPLCDWGGDPESPVSSYVAQLKRETTGWEEIGAKAREIRDEMNAEAPTVIMTKSWHLASMLAFYSGQTDEIFCYENVRANNFEIWRQKRGGLEGANVVVVIKKSKPNKVHASYVAKYDKYHRKLDPLFERVEEAASLIVYPDGSTDEILANEVERMRLREFLIFRCYGFKGEVVKE